MATNQELYEIAKAKGDTVGMRNANDAQNQIRNANGEVAQLASADIANVAQQTAQTTPSASSYQSTTLPTTNNYSDYISAANEAQQEAALAELESAYKNNVSTLDASAAKIAPTYQAAKNETAATSEQSKRNFSEYANASGLNSGTSGQAELARNVTLQGNLSSLNQAQADALSSVDLQRTQLTTEYNSAIASAKASGDYELASALYQEAVRVDESLVSNALSQAGLDANQWSANYTLQQDALNRVDTQAATAKADAQTQKETMAAYGQALLQLGQMPSAEYLSAMGIDANYAQTYIAAVKAQTAAAAAAKATSSSSKSSSGSSSKPTLTYAQTMAAIEKNKLTPNVLSAYQYYMGESFDKDGGAMSSSDFSTFKNKLMGFRSTEGVVDQIEQNAGNLSDAQISELLSFFRIN